MYKPARRLGQVSCLGLVAVVLSGPALAQAGQSGQPGSVPQQDVFAPWHESLSDAADRTMAAALSDKTWMKASAVDSAGTSLPSRTRTDPVVRLRAAVERVGQLRPTIEPILREEGVPAELIAVALVESGGQTTALSPKGARGVWQFMPDTARQYGLAVEGAKDERVDVKKSTRAAARYLHDLYKQFGNWPLALAAYNAGENAVSAASARTGSTDFTLIRSWLPAETRNYVPAVLRAIGQFSGAQPKLFVSAGTTRVYAIASF